MNEPSLEADNARPYNETLLTMQLTGNRYTEAAKWSRVSGAAIVQWTMTKKGEARHIRILSEAHTLLAGFAIEAAAAATLDLDGVDRDLLPSTRRARFSFGEP